MKLFNGFELVTTLEANRMRNRIVKTLEGQFDDIFESKDKTIRTRNKTIRNLNEELEEFRTQCYSEISDLQLKITILEEKREDVREIINMEMTNTDKESMLNEFKSNLEKRQAKLNERETKLDTADNASYKNGYADGVSDGVREISKITQKDRDNAMKIAMVSAASHTPVDNIKEINNELRLSEGTRDS